MCVRASVQISFSLLTLPFLSPFLPSSLALPPSVLLLQPLLFDGTQELLISQPLSILTTLCYEPDRQTQGRLSLLPQGMAIRVLGLFRGGSAAEKERVIEKELQEEKGASICRGPGARNGPKLAPRPQLRQCPWPPGARAGAAFKILM